MTEIFNTVLASGSAELTIGAAVTAMAAALIFGFIISVTYLLTNKGSLTQRGFVITLTMLPVILTAIILFVGSNVARAFSLAGTLSIIRFRSAPGDPKDIGYIFFDIAAGLACGVGLYGYGAVFVLLLCLTLILIEYFGFGQPLSRHKTLKITVPENLNYDEAFTEILNQSGVKSELIKIRTTDLGSLFELVYDVVLDRELDERQLLDDLRCRNGNLSISLTSAKTSD